MLINHLVFLVGVRGSHVINLLILPSTIVFPRASIKAGTSDLLNSTEAVVDAFKAQTSASLLL